MTHLPINKLHRGDCLQHLRRLPPNCVDLVCTDPPYGIGFSGLRWDTFAHLDACSSFGAFMTTVGKELLRVLKPGGFLFMSMTPRQDCLSRVLVALEDAGFAMGFTSLYWTFASGFPKACNVGKAVDKRSRRAPDAHSVKGSYGGFQPKPAVEVIVVAMKPLTERTFVDQALANGKGVTWFDDCRIPVETPITLHRARPGTFAGGGIGGSGCAVYCTSDLGRFPANLLVSDDVLNDGKVRKGSVTSKAGKVYGTERGNGYLQTKAHGRNIGDTGSYSRYFSLDAWAKTLPFLIVPKPSRVERDAGIAPGANTHPTVKPLALMSYLVTLGSRPGDLVLDPFAGSGTTLLAARMLGRRYLGIERDTTYAAIARKRLASSSAVPQCSAMERYAQS